MNNENSMTAPTPEQMRALAEDLERGNGRYRSEVIAEAAAALRAAADQLEAVRSIVQRLSHATPRKLLEQALGTAPQEDGND